MTDLSRSAGPGQPRPVPGRSGSRPPGPPAPWLGLPLLRRMRRDYLGFVAATKAYGEVSHSRILYEQTYDVTSPALMRAVLVDHADRTIRWERAISVFEQVFGRSVLTSEGALWQRQRRMLQPAFAPRRVAGYATLMREAAQEGLDHIEDGAVLVMDDWFTGVTMDAILRTMFSARASDDVLAASDAIQCLSSNALREMFLPVTLPDWLPLPGKARKRRALRLVRELVERHVGARWPAGASSPAASVAAVNGADAADAAASGDLLDGLLAIRDEQTGAGLTRIEVLDQCMISFQAGHETSATALLWWSDLVARHPDLQQKLADEIDRVLAGRAPEPQDCARLEWLTASLKEAMRLYPPVPALMSRRVVEPFELGGWTMPRGALLRLTPYVLHRDPALFPEPAAFRPERFLPDAPPLPRGAWLPFGAGPRVCIGQHFAMLEMTLIAAMLLAGFRLESTSARPPVPGLAVTLRPTHPVRLRVHRREAG